MDHVKQKLQSNILPSKTVISERPSANTALERSKESTEEKNNDPDTACDKNREEGGEDENHLAGGNVRLKRRLSFTAYRPPKLHTSFSMTNLSRVQQGPIVFRETFVPVIQVGSMRIDEKPVMRRPTLSKSFHSMGELSRRLSMHQETQAAKV